MRGADREMRRLMKRVISNEATSPQKASARRSVCTDGERTWPAAARALARLAHIWKRLPPPLLFVCRVSGSE